MGRPKPVFKPANRTFATRFCPEMYRCRRTVPPIYISIVQAEQTTLQSATNNRKRSAAQKSSAIKHTSRQISGVRDPCPHYIARKLRLVNVTRAIQCMRHVPRKKKVCARNRCVRAFPTIVFSHKYNPCIHYSMKIVIAIQGTSNCLFIQIHFTSPLWMRFISAITRLVGIQFSIQNELTPFIESGKGHKGRKKFIHICPNPRSRGLHSRYLDR